MASTAHGGSGPNRRVSSRWRVVRGTVVAGRLGVGVEGLAEGGPERLEVQGVVDRQDIF